MDLKQALEAVGLTDKEAAVYLALLQLGESTAYVIADRAEQKKPTTYVLLENLIDKGCVKRVPRARKQLFQATPPEEVFAFAEERFTLAKEKLPDLKALKKNIKTDFNALYFSGKPAMKKALQWGLDTMKGKTYVGFYAHGENIPKDMYEYIWDWTKVLKKQNTKIEGIVPKHPTLKEFRKTDTTDGRTFKPVPVSEYSSEISIDASDDHIRILDMKNMQGIIIENPDVAKTVQQIFKMLWKRL